LLKTINKNKQSPLIFFSFGYGLLGCGAVYFGTQASNFSRNLLPPTSGLPTLRRRTQEDHYLHSHRRENLKFELT
jgi:hypothetical protein